MKTLRITAAVLLALTVAACVGSPTGPSLVASDAVARQVDGTGYMGGGTREP